MMNNEGPLTRKKSAEFPLETKFFKNILYENSSAIRRQNSARSVLCCLSAVLNMEIARVNVKRKMKIFLMECEGNKLGAREEYARWH